MEQKTEQNPGESKKAKKQKKPERWVKPRHQLMGDLSRPFLWSSSRLLYGFSPEKIAIPSPDGKRQKDRQMLILYNHQTPFDQFYIGLTFRRAVYYLASEDIFSNGFVSALLKWSVNPIPIDKSTTDIRAIGRMSKACREGGSIAIAPEGNRTYSGATGYIKPSIVSLCRKLRLPIALFRIENGYSVHPRFSDKRRRGIRVRGYVYEILEPEVYDAMSDGELYSRIVAGLSVKEPNAATKVRGKHLAEYLERAIYVCPACGKFSTLESRGCDTVCTSCGLTVTHRGDGSLTEGEKPFRYPDVCAWYRAQEYGLSSLDAEAFARVSVPADRVALYRVELCKSKKLLDKNAALALFSDRIELTAEGKTDAYPFDPNGVRSFSILGRNKLNLRVKREDGEILLLQCRGGKHFNALKYLHFFTHAQNLRAAENNQTTTNKEENQDECREFLGL